MANDTAAYSAGYSQGQADAANRVNSAAPAEYQGNADYDAGYADGLAQASDAQSYGEGQTQGRYDTVHRQSSAPPEYANPETHYNTPGSPGDAYNRGYQEGASAPPYTSDVEAKEKEDREAREASLRNTYPAPDPNFQPGPAGPPQTSMSPITEQQEEAAKRYTEEKEANERYLEQHKDWEDELKRTTPEDVFPNPIAD